MTRLSELLDPTRAPGEGHPSGEVEDRLRSVGRRVDSVLRLPAHLARRGDVTRVEFSSALYRIPSLVVVDPVGDVVSAFGPDHLRELADLLPSSARAPWYPRGSGQTSHVGGVTRFVPNALFARLVGVVGALPEGTLVAAREALRGEGARGSIDSALVLDEFDSAHGDAVVRFVEDLASGVPVEWAVRRVPDHLRSPA